jgi:O-antigen ligase
VPDCVFDFENYRSSSLVVTPVYAGLLLLWLIHWKFFKLVRFRGLLAGLLIFIFIMGAAAFRDASAIDIVTDAQDTPRRVRARLLASTERKR